MIDKEEMPREITKKKIRHHIPKIMLDLYENRKSFNNFSKADVVRSLIPKISGKFFDLLFVTIKQALQRAL